MLDDVFDKLDDLRIEKLIEMVAMDTFGQIFVTDARPERSKEIFKRFSGKVKTFLIHQGMVNELN